MQIKDCEPGTSYACRFKTLAFLDEQGRPVQVNLTIGQAHPGTPGVYESVGIIQIRDLENQRVQLQDTQSDLTFAVNIQDCWDIDRIEWVDKA